MKTSMAKLAVVVLVILLVRESEAAISCSDVLIDLKPCVSYLVMGSGKPPEDCCAGAKTLEAAATSADDKKTVCECLKSAAGKLNPNVKSAQDLPGNCGISLPFTVSTSVDCSKIS